VKQDVSTTIKRPLVTEKSVEEARTGNTYHFEVAREANKTQIKQAVEEMFNVRVQSVRTALRKGKMRRVKFHKGKTRDWKRAVVTLVPGDTIELI
jgi:large subunit ribosomal protein L23